MSLRSRYSRLLEGVDIPTKPAKVEDIIRILIAARTNDATRIRGALDLYSNAQSVIEDNDRTLLRQIWFAAFSFSPYSFLFAC